MLLMKRHITALFSLTPSLIAPFQLGALGPGDIAFVGFNAGGNSNVAFITLVPISGGADIFLSDNESNGQPPGASGAFLE